MSTTTSTAADAPTTRTGSRIERLGAKYREDHQHPVNHVLHVYVGWPLCALGVLALPFNPLWTLYGFLAGYTAMWTGHFVFEKNIPTILKHPSTPFVMAWTVSKGLVTGLVRLVRGR